MPLSDVLLCLTTRGNDYQRQQAADAERAAQALGVKLTIIDADNDAINQSQLLLKAIQTKGKRPDAIIFEPVSGTGLPHVARAAVDAGRRGAVAGLSVGGHGRNSARRCVRS